MDYFIIDDIDFSKYVSGLSVNSVNNYTAQLNANGDSVVDYINKKREITITVIPIDKEAMILLNGAIEKFNVSISFINPKTGEIEQDVNCIVPDNEIDFYTIQNNRILYNSLELKFIEL